MCDLGRFGSSSRGLHSDLGCGSFGLNPCRSNFGGRPRLQTETHCMKQQPLAPSSLLYRFSAPCAKTENKFTAKGIELDERYSLPHFGQIDRQDKFADVRVAWGSSGLFVCVEVSRKQQSLWCRHTQMLESDRVMFWVDTRDTHNVHRATRFCHWFLVLPIGGGGTGKQPLATMLKINRSKEDSPTLNQYKQQTVTRITIDGYNTMLHIPGKCLNGWNPEEHKKIGFNYAIVDRELGWQTLSTGPELPIEEDPSLWQTLELVD